MEEQPSISTEVALLELVLEPELVQAAVELVMYLEIPDPLDRCLLRMIFLDHPVEEKLTFLRLFHSRQLSITVVQEDAVRISN